MFWNEQRSEVSGTQEIWGPSLFIVVNIRWMHKCVIRHNDPNSTLNNTLEIDPNYLGHQYTNYLGHQYPYYTMTTA